MNQTQSASHSVRSRRIARLVVGVVAGLGISYAVDRSHVPAAADATGTDAVDQPASAAAATTALIPVQDEAPEPSTLPQLQSGDQVIKEIDGAGSTTTRPIQVTGSWELQWALSDHGMLSVLDLDGQPVDTRYIPETARTGTAYQAKGGRLSLEIHSEGTWRLRIVKVGR